MNLYLDNIVYSLQTAGGISVYWYELSKRLLLSGNHVLFLEEEKTNNIFREQLDIPANNLLQKHEFPVSLARYLPVKHNYTIADSLFHSSYYRTPSNKNLPSIVTVHDFTYERMKKGIKKWIHQTQKKAALDAARGIICISEHTKNDMLDLYPYLAEKEISVIYNGVSDAFFPLHKKELTPTAEDNDIKEIINTDYAVFIGGREAYKNFLFAVTVVRELSGYHLVIVGGGALTKDETTFLQQNLGNKWKAFSGINNSKLNKLYNFARFLLYPSAYEGFGIPVIEAEKAGCPVIALNSTSLPEVTGNQEMLLNSLDVGECLQKIRDIESKHDNIITKGFENSKKYSWDTCYDEVTAFYESILPC